MININNKFNINDEVYVIYNGVKEYTEPCSWCSGTGNRQFFVKRTCFHCQGTGKHNYKKNVFFTSENKRTIIGIKLLLDCNGAVNILYSVEDYFYSDGTFFSLVKEEADKECVVKNSKVI